MSMRRTSRCVPIKCYYQARFCICSLLALKFIVASPEIWGLRIWRRRLDWIYLFLLSNLAEMYFIAPPNCWNISRSPKSLLHIAFRATILCPNFFELKALPCHRYYFFISFIFSYHYRGFCTKWHKHLVCCDLVGHHPVMLSFRNEKWNENRKTKRGIQCDRFWDQLWNKVLIPRFLTFWNSVWPRP